MLMIYTSKRGKQIVFDDYVDNTEEYNSYWTEICPHCHNKFKGILGNKCSDKGEAVGICSVKGCENEADYYVDFPMNEIVLKDEKGEKKNMGLDVIREEEFSIKPFSHVMIGDKYSLRQYEESKVEKDIKKQYEALMNVCDEKISITNRSCSVILREYKEPNETDDFSMKMLLFYSKRKDISWLDEEISALKEGMHCVGRIREYKRLETLGEYHISIDGKTHTYDLGGDDWIGFSYHYMYNYMFFYKIYLPCEKTFEELKEDIKTLFNIK